MRMIGSVKNRWFHKTRSGIYMALINMVFVVLVSMPQVTQAGSGVSGGKLYDLRASLDSRSISFEHPTGERGAGGRVASSLGVGRKGTPARIANLVKTATE